MNLTRREFLKALGAAGLAAALPAGALPDPRRPFLVSFDFGDLTLRDADYSFSFFAKATVGPFPNQWTRISKMFRPTAGQRSITIDLEDEKDCQWDQIGAGMVGSLYGDLARVDREVVLAGVQLVEESMPTQPFIPTENRHFAAPDVSRSRTNLLLRSHSLRDRWGRML